MMANWEIKEAFNKKLDALWNASRMRGAPPKCWLSKIQKLKAAAINTSDVHNEKLFVSIKSNVAAALLDQNSQAYKDAYDDYIAIRRYDNLHGTVTNEIDHEEVDAYGNVYFRLVPVHDNPRRKEIRSARQQSQKESVKKRKSKQKTTGIVERYQKANNKQALVATRVADWAIETGLWPAIKRRSLIARLKRGFAT